MLRRVLVGMGFVLTLLLLTSTALAQGPGPKHSDPHWQASYWNNTSLSGTPAREETVAHIGFDWGYGSPHHTVATEGFSARWKRYIEVGTGTYRFTATSDDGIRVYVDDHLIIDEWHDHPARTYSADYGLQAGHHLVTVEYYENTGAAAAKLSWTLSPVQPGPWRGQYYDNRWLSGSPVLTRSEAKVGFDWGTGSPAPEVPSDNFSARWTRTVPFEWGDYRFTATSDDGIRVYVDNRLIIDEWHDHPAQSYTTDLNLAGGPHEIVVEYYEHAGAAVAKLEWARLSGTTTWRGEYYGNRWLSGSPVLTRDDENIDFDWGYGTPSSHISNDGFSVRWTRTVHLESGLYRFTTTTDDGVRLWVNNHLLIDKWVDQAARSHSGTIHVSGDVPIKMEYYENGGVASARLTWTRIGDEPPPPAPGEVIVDDSEPGFVQGGSSTGWHTTAGGYGGSLTWTKNNDRVRPRYNWARWYPDLEPGCYEVYAYIPEYDAMTSNARYWVAHQEGFTLRRVDQASNRGDWVSLGTYRFRGQGGEYVSLADVTYESYLSTTIVFDAVKWSPRVTVALAVCGQ
jgi:hypothetical protein